MNLDSENSMVQGKVSVILECGFSDALILLTDLYCFTGNQDVGTRAVIEFMKTKFSSKPMSW
jgi:hypothetical protein